MHLLRCLAFIEAQYGFHIRAEYIDTRSKHLADDLSHNNLFYFHSKAPAMDTCPTQVSTNLMELLLDPSADWTSPAWRPRFSAIFRQA